MTKVAKAVLAAIIAVAICVIAFITFRTFNPKLDEIMWYATTIAEMQKANNQYISVSGYMSSTSPADQTCAYLTSKPLNAQILQREDVVDTIVCYPSYGLRLEYTDKCIRVTGKIIGEPMEADCFGLSYPFYLVDCTYEVIEPTDAVVTYHTMLADGVMKAFDGYLSEVYSLMEGNDVTINDENKKVLETFDGGEEYKACIDAAYNMEKVARVWYDAGHSTESEEYTDMVNANADLVSKLSNWFSSMEVKGNE